MALLRKHLDFRWRFSHLLLSRTILLAISLLFLSAHSSYANNVTVENASLVEQDSDDDTIKVEFDLSWNNAWYDSSNNDAVWLFLKYNKNPGTDTWEHGTLAASGTNPTDFGRGTKQSGSAFARVDIIVPADKLGAFIQPSAQGAGTVDFHDVQLVWDYGADGISDAEASASTMDVKVFAVEMVYIPEEGFYAGDGSDGSASTEAQFEMGTGTQNITPAVSSEAGISFRSNSADKWYYNSGGNSGEAADGAEFDVGEAFPKGFAAFYLMKYELSQGQYRDFLNTLTQAQQNSRTQSDLSNENDANTYVMIGEAQATPVARQTIKAGSNPANGAPYTFGCDLDDDNVLNETNDGEWIAMNYLHWTDLAAYADWAALRPVTELEFEKAARGPLSPVDGEYVWGSTSITEAQTLSSGGQSGEVVTESGNGLANYNNNGNGINGPARVGFAATSSTATRAAAGAGYYGNMELSGNLYEMLVTVGNATGRGFAGTHGDGTLTTTTSYEGNATNIDWPGISSTASQGVTGVTGAGRRGGAFTIATVDVYNLELSNRNVAAYVSPTRANDEGGRLARSAP